MEDTRTNKRTIEERIEQHAHDIVIAALAIETITIGAARGTPNHRMKLAARSILFIADGILKGGKDELQTKED